MSSKIDSRTFRESREQAPGKGDMLFMSSANRIVRIHGPFVSENEIEKIVNSIRAQGEPDYMDEITAHTTMNFFYSEGTATKTNYTQTVDIIKSELASTEFLQENYKSAIIGQLELLI